MKPLLKCRNTRFVMSTGSRSALSDTVPSRDVIFGKGFEALVHPQSVDCNLGLEVWRFN